jgi:hypothetical protein
MFPVASVAGAAQQHVRTQLVGVNITTSATPSQALMRSGFVKKEAKHPDL